MKKYTIIQNNSSSKEVWADSYIQALLEERDFLVKNKTKKFNLEVFNKTDKLAVYSKS